MKIVFAGTPNFAVPPLHGLLQSGHEIIAAYTQPDRPQGRGRKVQPSPVKVIAEEAGVKVLQPASFRDPGAIDELRSLAPDLMVVVAYGLILPADVIHIPRLGCINIHASLLPRWRGAAPIQRAILEGDLETGVTIMYIEEQLDAGPMILTRSTPIEPGESSGHLHDRLALIGKDALLEAITRIDRGQSDSVPQEPGLANYAPKISKEEARIDFHKDARTLDLQIRAFNPWPVAETVLNGQTLRIWRAEPLDKPSEYAPGTLFQQDLGLFIATGSGCLRILELQLPGGKRISDRDFLNTSPSLPVPLGLT